MKPSRSLATDRSVARTALPRRMAAAAMASTPRLITYRSTRTLLSTHLSASKNGKGDRARQIAPHRRASSTRSPPRVLIDPSSRGPKIAQGLHSSSLLLEVRQKSPKILRRKAGAGFLSHAHEPPMLRRGLSQVGCALPGRHPGHAAVQDACREYVRRGGRASHAPHSGCFPSDGADRGDPCLQARCLPRWRCARAGIRPRAGRCRRIARQDCRCTAVHTGRPRDCEGAPACR
jgi:hypothetical protein